MVVLLLMHYRTGSILTVMGKHVPSRHLKSGLDPWLMKYLGTEKGIVYEKGKIKKQNVPYCITHLCECLRFPNRSSNSTLR